MIEPMRIFAWLFLYCWNHGRRRAWSRSSFSTHMRSFQSSASWIPCWINHIEAHELWVCSTTWWVCDIGCESSEASKLQAEEFFHVVVSTLVVNYGGTTKMQIMKKYFVNSTDLCINLQGRFNNIFFEKLYHG
jgi:hypothetical protein